MRTVTLGVLQGLTGLPRHASTRWRATMENKLGCESLPKSSLQPCRDLRGHPSWVREGTPPSGTDESV